MLSMGWKNRISGLGLVVLVVLLNACGGGGSGDAGNEHNITGLVRSASGDLLADVEVSTESDGVVAYTDAEGRFRLTLPASRQVTLRFRKAGYSNQSIPLDAGSGETHVETAMRERGPAIRIDNAENGFEYTDPAGARVIIQPQTLVYRDTSGQTMPVTGSVILQVTPVDVSSDEQLEAFPGAFGGFDMTGNPVDMLLSYGTVEFNLALPDGTPVNLATNATATIEIPVFVSQHMDGSPVTEGETGQALWYLDEDSGQWRQESDSGVIVASANSPTGLALRADVPHFSWWNYDVAAIIGNGSACRTRIQVVGLNGNSIRGVIRATTTSKDAPRFAIQTLSGNETFELNIPAGVDITLTGYAETSFGLFKAPARTFMGCEKGPNGRPLPQIISFAGAGPYPPEIRRFDAVVRPVFALVNGQYAVQSNEVTFYYDVWGTGIHGMLIRNLNTGETLGLTSGSRKARRVIDTDTDFELVAANDGAGGSRKSVSVTYVSSAPPVPGQLYYTYSPPPADVYTVHWVAHGADQIRFGYVDSIDTNMTAPIETGTSTEPVGSGKVSIPSDRPGSQDLYVMFTNQYGTVVKRVLAWNQCLDPLYGGIPLCGLFGGGF